MMVSRRWFHAGSWSLLVALGVAGYPSDSGAQAAWSPTQPVKFVVPFQAGTGMDTIARTVAPRIAERFGQPVIVENRPGASGNIGAEAVSKAPPDGHTVLVGANTMIVASLLYKSTPFHPINDFTPLTLSAWGSLILVANPKASFDSLNTLIAQARAKPGEIAYASAGIGTPQHVGMEMLRDVVGIELVHVPYKGGASALTDVIAGQVPVFLSPIHVAMPHVNAGKLKALAVGGAKRHSIAPGVPSFSELGVKGVDVDMWYAFWLPKNAASAIAQRMTTELRAVLADATVKAQLEKAGLEVASSTPQELTTLMQRDYPRWSQLLRKNRITAD
jgi:tripartite-type tricarboxylate transporter receptor subunit TctC